ncbi:MAG: hypothetical protein A3F16_02180 [Deltaproteobacteria bacterium RIFCSPHIGHO2_12_FULL_43_9]|nr:MAG: hypothetical protein A3F16_02180 [Deltaproteobacteria bacterium RIFCSPHIGHO2_12_FULL_43_9]
MKNKPKNRIKLFLPLRRFFIFQKKPNQFKEELDRYIHELRDSQAQLIQADKLSIIGERVSSLIHDINNPLTVISGYTKVLRELIAEPVPLRHPEPTIRHPEPKAKDLDARLLRSARNDDSRHPEPTIRHPEPTIRHPEPKAKDLNARLLRSARNDDSRHPEPTIRHPEPKAKDLNARLLRSARNDSTSFRGSNATEGISTNGAAPRNDQNVIPAEAGISSHNNEVEDYLNRIDRGVEKIKSLVDHIRNFSRISNQKLIETNLNEVINNAILMVETELKSANIRVTKELASTPPKILGDPNELEQVIVNLITNAKDSMTDLQKEKPDYQAELAIFSRETENGAEIVIKDNGKGIPEAIREKIFSPFFTTKEYGKGTGLGLSISRNIIKRHGANISVDSKLGETTSFTLKFTSNAKDINA